MQQYRECVFLCVCVCFFATLFQSKPEIRLVCTLFWRTGPGQTLNRDTALSRPLLLSDCLSVCLCVCASLDRAPSPPPGVLTRSLSGSGGTLSRDTDWVGQQSVFYRPSLCRIAGRRRHPRDERLWFKVVCYRDCRVVKTQRERRSIVAPSAGRKHFRRLLPPLQRPPRTTTGLTAVGETETRYW